jgi:hypothetical protein
MQSASPPPQKAVLRRCLSHKSRPPCPPETLQTRAGSRKGRGLPGWQRFRGVRSALQLHTAVPHRRLCLPPPTHRPRTVRDRQAALGPVNCMGEQTRHHHPATGASCREQCAVCCAACCAPPCLSAP